VAPRACGGRAPTAAAWSSSHCWSASTSWRQTLAADVVGIAAQPLALLWPRNTTGHRGHVPDFSVRLGNGDGRLDDVRHPDRVEKSAAQCASPAIVGYDEVASRRNQTGVDDLWALTYPEQVKIARLLTRPGFLRSVTNPDDDEAQRRALVAVEVETIITARGDADPWRAISRVSTVIHRLIALRRDARIYGVPVRDTSYNMLRLI
jgi:hypothetical protein